MAPLHESVETAATNNTLAGTAHVTEAADMAIFTGVNGE